MLDSRPVDESDSVYWPAREVAVLVEIADFETDAHYIEDGIAVGQQYFRNDWRFRVVPVLKGQSSSVFSDFFLRRICRLPDQGFVQMNGGSISTFPSSSSEIAKSFDEAFTACVQLSAIMACCVIWKIRIRRRRDVFSKSIESFKHNSEIVDRVG